MIFGSVYCQFFEIVSHKNYEMNTEFDAIFDKMTEIKNRNSYLLRPNLANPACKEEFDSLNTGE